MPEETPPKDLPADLESLLLECLEAEDPAAEVKRRIHDRPELQSFAPRLLARLREYEGTRPVGAPADAPSLAPYRILGELGSGGMGTVYLAEQRFPVKRRVALKVIKAGMDTRAVMARFEAERQALALMEHSGIAKVFDAGATPQGRPYFAMEYVKGIPITRYCDEHRLSLDERLALFREVCSAVQHAHTKGVIHRDLTPNNVLVTVQDGRPTPKIIDFGLARATDQHLTEKTVFTEQGVILGTPEYMSPEQAGLDGLDVDMRSDVYTLGVLLYELLTGALPFSRDQLRRAGYDKMCEIIRSQDPAKPSTQITRERVVSDTVANARRTDVDQLLRRLRGDLDWVVLKCLEKDRTRRYETVSQLAEDVLRHLQHEEVLAHAPSVRYRFAKFARRHRGRIVAAGLVLTALVVGLIGTTVFAFAAVRERQEARRQAGIARAQAELAEASAARERLATAAAAASAERERVAAEQAREQTAHAVRQTYRATMAAAQRAWDAGDGAALEHALAAAPEALRGFEWHYYRANADQSAARLPLQDRGQVAISPDGRLLAIAGPDGRIEVIDADVGSVGSSMLLDRAARHVVTVRPDAPCRGLHFAPGGRASLVAVDAKDKVTVWDMPTGQLRGTSQGFPLSLSAGGERLLVRRERTFDVIVLATGLVAQSTARDDLTDAALSEDGLTILHRRHVPGRSLQDVEPWIDGVVVGPRRLRIRASPAGALAVCDRSGDHLVWLRGHLGRARVASAARTAERIVTVGDDSVLRVWDLDRAAAWIEPPIAGRAAWDARAQRAILSDSSRCAVVSVATGEGVAVPIDGDERLMASCLLADEAVLATRSVDPGSALPRGDAGALQKELEKRLDKQMLDATTGAAPQVPASEVWTLRRVDLGTGRPSATSIRAVAGPSLLARGPSGRDLIVGSPDGSLLAWDRPESDLRPLCPPSGVPFSWIGTCGAQLLGIRPPGILVAIDVATGLTRTLIERDVTAVAEVEGTSTLWVAMTARLIEFDPRTATELRQRPIARCEAIGQRGGRVALRTVDGYVTVYDTFDLASLAAWRLPGVPLSGSMIAWTDDSLLMVSRSAIYEWRTGAVGPRTATPAYRFRSGDAGVVSVIPPFDWLDNPGSLRHTIAAVGSAAIADGAESARDRAVADANSGLKRVLEFELTRRWSDLVKRMGDQYPDLDPILDEASLPAELTDTSVTGVRVLRHAERDGHAYSLVVLIDTAGWLRRAGSAFVTRAEQLVPTIAGNQEVRDRIHQTFERAALAAEAEAFDLALSDPSEGRRPPR